jgi:cytochrome c oxidase subunit 1
MTTATTATADHHDDHHGHPTGIKRWLMTTNHKDIGFMYLIFSGAMFFVAGLLALVFRAELAVPGLQFLNGSLFNQLVTLHGLIMVFAFIMPFTTGMNNYLIPMMIGASDMALPRLNNWGFWILPPAAVMLLIPFFLQFFGIGDGAAQNAWTMDNVALDMQSGIGMDFTIVVVHMLGISSITGAINVIVTILNLRAPGMSLWKMPLFCWGWLVVSFLLLLVIPVLGAVVTMLLTDRHFGTHFFLAAGGGDPVLFQHLLWFFGHPEVYIILLPAWSILPTILAAFARKPIYGYKAQVYSFWAIGFLGSIVWAHHMLSQGMPLAGNLYFMYATFSISIPTAVMIFCWLGTIWRGSMTFETPMLFALAMIESFGIGGLTGIVIPDIAAYAQYHNTYYVVGHFHYPFFGGAVLGMMATVYFYLPKMTGHMYNEKLGKLHFWLTFISFNVTFFPMMLVGLSGMPRHLADYATKYAGWNMVSSIGAAVLGLSQLIMLYNVIQTARGKGAKAGDKPWEGATGLEWTLSSPPPYHSFTIPPEVK